MSKNVLELSSYAKTFDGKKTVPQDTNIGKNTDQTPKAIKAEFDQYNSLKPEYLKSLKPTKMVESLVAKYTAIVEAQISTAAKSK